ncbi:MAG: tRNA (cytidine(34)-2'-O)-methyltransferase [Thermoanaerobaculia bacterium]
MNDLHLVLLAPEIPWNTGNVGRTCLALGASLHLVRPLGFSLSDREVRRSGLDYWERVRPRIWDRWPDLEAALPELGSPWFFSAEAGTELAAAAISSPAVLVFGAESAGLPGDLRTRFRHRLVRIPMRGEVVRSLNLSTAVAVAGFEVRRRWDEARTGA